mgnify:FL=1
MSQYAYARVSSKTQNLARQTDCFLALGIPKNNNYSDKLSGKDFDRKNYERLLRKLRRDDVLVVSSIDRLGRNYDMILKEWTRITKTIGADVIVLDMPLLDTRAQTGDLTGRFVADLVLQILSYVAQKERENIKERQREGISSAKKRGVRFGRPSVPQPDAFSDIVRGYKEKAISFDEALSLSNMKKTTFYLRMNELCALSAET